MTAVFERTATTDSTQSRRWVMLVFIALAQLMIALDATIMNIALPSAQRALGFSDGNRQWVITAYTLAFGGLLLLGGRIADQIGRHRAFLIGLTGFAAASALAGAAADFTMLAVARAAQGAFAALLAPTALSLLAVTFAEQRERARAFAIFGAIAGGGGALGLVLGGVLTQNANWRWCCYINALVAIVAAAGSWRLIPRGAADRRGRLDAAGAVLVTAGVAAVVFGFSRVTSTGWISPSVLAGLPAGAGLLAAFVLRESRFPEPLLPLRILRDRARAGAYFSVGFAVAGLLAMFLFLTYYLQTVLGYSPIAAGVAFLPLSAAAFVSSQAVAGRLLPHLPARRLIVPGLLTGAVAMVLLTRLSATGGYVSHVLPAEILLGLGMGCVFVPAFHIATSRVDHREAGVASAVVNTAQQVGGSIGVALLNTIAAGAAAARSPAGLVHGYTVAAGWAAGMLAAGALLAAALITGGNHGR